MSATNDDFLAYLQAEIRRIRTRDHELAEQEESVRRERADLRTRHASVMSALQEYQDYKGIKVVEPPDRGLFDANGTSDRSESPAVDIVGVGAVGAVALGTIGDLSFTIMSERGGRMKVANVVQELARIGKVKGTHNDYGTVHGTMKRDPRFVQVGKGEYAIASPSAPERPA